MNPRTMILAGMTGAFFSFSAQAELPWEKENSLNLDVQGVQQNEYAWDDQCFSCTAPVVTRAQQETSSNGLDWGDETRVGMGFDVGGMTIGAYGDVNELVYAQAYDGGFRELGQRAATGNTLVTGGIGGGLVGGNSATIQATNNVGAQPISLNTSFSGRSNLSLGTLGGAALNGSGAGQRAGSTSSGSENAYTEYVGGLFMATSF